MTGVANVVVLVEIEPFDQILKYHYYFIPYFKICFTYRNLYLAYKINARENEDRQLAIITPTYMDIG